MKKDNYNYQRFSMDAYRDVTLPGPEVGDQFGDFGAVNLDGDPVRFRDLLTKPMVIETGSVTCPIYAHNVSKMDRLAHEYPQIQFVVLYVREAHPGNTILPHETLADKLKQAQRLSTGTKNDRTVLVDDVDGTIHRTYGDLPNTLYFVNPEGTVLYRSNWNQPDCLEQALQAYPEILPHLDDNLSSPNPNPLLALRILSRGGFSAVKHFFMAMPGMMKQAKNQKERAQLC